VRPATRGIELIPVFLLVSLLFATGTGAKNSIGEPGRGSKKVIPLDNVYFGEQYLRSQISVDAFAIGTRNTRDDE
jgi:hypothetical protein